MSVATEPLGWSPVAFAEIEPFPSAVLAHRYPNVPNLGDITQHENWSIEPGTIDIVAGGPPCQSFSVAGKRGGLHDERGNLILTFLEIAARLRPRWIIFENVPGLLSSDNGNDFRRFLRTLTEIGYGYAYRILDAQHFGVPQRRRRVYVVANFGDWRRCAEVLFEPESLRGNPTESRQKRKGAPARAGNRVEIIGTLCADSHPGAYSGQDAYTGRLIPTVIDRAAFNQREGAQYPPRIEPSETMSALVARGPHAIASPEPIAFHPTQDPISSVNVTHTMSTGGTGGAATIAVAQAYAVRRLTPTECERLQGFPDDWTAVPFRGKPAADGPRYKAIGNSMATPVIRWIAERITAIDTQPQD